jgi:hypothetical protein
MLPDARQLFSVDPADALRWFRFRGTDTPERLLSLAVMCQALTDLRRAPRGQTHGKDRHLYAETQAWFRDDTDGHPYSFRAVCDRFDWSAEAVRARVLGADTAPEPVQALRLVRRR